jgi:uncharacterized protein YjbJ (UPF0337 family)
MTGRMRRKWGALIDDDFQRIARQRAKLVGKIWKSCGGARKGAEKQMNDFVTTPDTQNGTHH